MLGKLLKYEMKASARTLIPLYIGTLVAAVICAFITASIVTDDGARFIMFTVMYGDAPGIFSAFVFLLFFGLCVAIMVLTAMIVIQRFNKNLIGDEGYLMFTLPVTHVQLLSSKLIAGLLWVLIGTIIMFLSGVIIGSPGVLLNLDLIDWADFWNEVQYLLGNWNPIPYIISTTLNGIVSVIAFILVVYLSIMVGQMEQFNKHRVAVSVVLFFIINWVFSLVETTIFRIFDLDMYHSLSAASDTIREFSQAYNLVMWSNIAFTVVQCALCFAGVIWLMKKKLNL